MRHERLAQVCLGLLAVSTLAVGVWAAVFPGSFYADFPSFGRHWVDVDGPFNEHLIRDVGQYNLAMTVLLVIAALRPERVLVAAASITYLVAALPHTLYHVTHLGGFTAADAVALPVSLVWGIGLAGVALWACSPRGRSSSQAARPDPTPRHS